MFLRLIKLFCIASATITGYGVGEKKAYISAINDAVLDPHNNFGDKRGPDFSFLSDPNLTDRTKFEFMNVAMYPCEKTTPQLENDPFTKCARHGKRSKQEAIERVIQEWSKIRCDSI